MDLTTQAVLFVLLGAVLGAGMVLAWWFSENRRQRLNKPEEPAIPAGAATVLSVLRGSALVINENNKVVKASAPAYALGLIRDHELCVAELAELVQMVRRDGQIREAEFVVTRGRSTLPIHVSARVAPLSSRLVLALVEDRTRERKVEELRRDFVANVSHELKTPVGAINLLAEAVHEASRDPEAVERFAGRMQMESVRLSRLVQQIIELSRIQGDSPLDEPLPVGVDDLIDHAIDHAVTDAEVKDIEVLHNGERGLEVLGSGDQLAIAIGNLVANAVTYSPNRSKVVVSAKTNDMMVEITVTDHGIGIPAQEVDRIFERFYRVDPARHRSTGGTGLGLSIVKHVAAAHGGEVRVWSVQNQGSSFTLTLPRHAPQRESRPTLPPVLPSSAPEPQPEPPPTPQEATP